VSSKQQAEVSDKARKVANTVAAKITKNPVANKIKETSSKVKSKIETLKEEVDESQHPLVWKVRDTKEKFAGETEMAYAIGELRTLDPNFNLPDFYEEMEDYLIPVLLDAIYRGDRNLIAAACEGEAREAIRAYLTEEDTKRGVKTPRKIVRIDQILHLEVRDALVVNDIPLLVLSFMARNKEYPAESVGKKVWTSTGNQNLFYQLVMRRDTEQGDFDWKILKLHFQHVQALS